MVTNNICEDWGSIESWDDENAFISTSCDLSANHVSAGDLYYKSDEELSDLETCDIIGRCKNPEFLELVKFVKADLESQGQQKRNFKK